MNSTIFCTFDQRDLADLAIGKLQSSVPGVHSAQYVSEYGSGAQQDRGAIIGGFALAAGYNNFNNAVVTPSRPVTVKITCDESSHTKVVSKLVNLHAYKIITTA